MIGSREPLNRHDTEEKCKELNRQDAKDAKGRKRRQELIEKRG
jgi:hypothetical protein